MIPSEPIVAWSDFDPERILFDREAIEQFNPHRFEMSLIDGIVHENPETRCCVGICRVRDDQFWVRGHFPGRPLMPGVLICELAAQICSYFALKYAPSSNNLIGLGSLEEVRFRAPVTPGKTLIMMIEQTRLRPKITKVRFQGYVDQTLAVDGRLTGFALPK